jgi:hypothetical protein
LMSPSVLRRGCVPKPGSPVAPAACKKAEAVLVRLPASYSTFFRLPLV